MVAHRKRCDDGQKQQRHESANGHDDLPVNRATSLPRRGPVAVSSASPAKYRLEAFHASRGPFTMSARLWRGPRDALPEVDSAGLLAEVDARGLRERNQVDDVHG